MEKAIAFYKTSNNEADVNAQVNSILECAKINNLKVTETVQCSSVTGNRFIELLKIKNKSKKIKNIIVSDLSRLTRYDADKLELMRMVKIKNITVHLANSNTIFNNPRPFTIEDEYALDVEILMYKHYSKTHSDSIKRGLQARKERLSLQN